jgi:hypothetical protein
LMDVPGGNNLVYLPLDRLLEGRAEAATAATPQSLANPPAAPGEPDLSPSRRVDRNRRER